MEFAQPCIHWSRRILHKASFWSRDIGAVPKSSNIGHSLMSEVFSCCRMPGQLRNLVFVWGALPVRRRAPFGREASLPLRKDFIRLYSNHKQCLANLNAT